MTHLSPSLVSFSLCSSIIQEDSVAAKLLEKHEQALIAQNAKSLSEVREKTRTQWERERNDCNQTSGSSVFVA